MPVLQDYLCLNFGGGAANIIIKRYISYLYSFEILICNSNYIYLTNPDVWNMRLT